MNLIDPVSKKPLNYILRYWEKEFKEIKPKKINNRRYYTLKDIELLKKIKFYLKDRKMSIASVKNILNYNVKNIRFDDELFVLDNTRVNAICDGLIERNYDLNIYGLARNNGLYLAHAESKYDQTGNNIIIDSITWVDAVIINQNLPSGQISENYRAHINHNIDGIGFGTIIGMQQGGFDTQVTVPIPHGTFPDGIPDTISSTNFAYNDNFLLFETSRSAYPGSPWVQSEPQLQGLSCLDREIFWSYVPTFGYGVYDSNGDRLSDSVNISISINGTDAIINGTNIITQFVCKNMNDGSVASDSDCINPSGNSYQYIPIIDVPDGTIISDSEGNQYYIRVLKPRKVYAYNDLTMCEDLSIQNPDSTPDHKTFVYLNEINIPPSGAIIYNQYNSGDSSDQQYLGRVYIANEDDDGDRVLNFLDAFPDDPTKSVDDDYDEIDDLEDTEIVQTEMVWNKYLDKDIFELSNE